MSGTIFISYSKDDLKWRKQIQKHLGVLEYSAGAEIWADDRIDEGDSWYEEIRSAIGRSAVGIMLLTPSFLGTGFIQKEEIPELIRRREEVGMLLIPILVEDCAWDTQRWLNQKHIQMTPPKGAPLETLKGKEQTQLLARLTEKIDKHLHSWSSDQIEDGYSNDPGRRPLPAVPTTSARPIVAEATPTADGIPKPVVDISHLPQTGLTLFGRDEQLNQLDEFWELASHRVVSYVAAGGVGKSSLVNKWMSEFAKDDYGGARRVYGWSFYSQGTRDQITSADAFLDQALRFFGDENPESGSPWDKGERLADLVSAERSLIVLDGMEPLQSGHDVDKGKLRDPGLQAFLTKLVQTESQSLCVVTTREKVTDLHELKPVESLLTLITRSASEQADKEPAKPFLEVPLDTITPDAGRALLRHTRVVGTDEELESLATEFGPHALTVLLLGAWLHQTPGHLASNAKDLPTEGDPLDRVLTGFEEFLGEGPELQLLRLLGLFDRPATAAELAAIAAGDQIPGLTKHLVPLEDVDEIESNQEDGHWGLWQPWLSKLRDLHLVAKHCHARPDDYDAHPLIREYFAESMKEEGSRHSSSFNLPPSSFREAHRRLYEHLKQSAPERPDNLNDMMPLYHAVAHGCKAGLWQEAHDDVHFSRIRRRNEYFSTKKLGAFGAEVSVLANFFTHPFSAVAENLRENDRAVLLNNIAIKLRAVGRLSDAPQPLGAAIRMQTSRESWSEAAKYASNLSELSLMLGDVSSAVRQGEQSVELADRSGDAFQRMGKRTTLAAALFCTGVTRWQGDRERPPGALASGLSDASVSVQARGAREPVSRGASATGQARNPATGQARNPAADAARLTALAAFREAEAIQQERRTQYPLLYSLAGYRYCELLLADFCQQIRGVRFRRSLQLAGSGEESRPDQAQRRSGNEESERHGASRRFDETPTHEEPAPGAGRLTEESEGTGTALRSVRPTDDSGEDRELEADATPASGDLDREGHPALISELQSEIESLRNRTETTLKYRDEGWYSLLDIALDHLTLGRTWQAEAELRKLQNTNYRSQMEQAEHHLTQSVTLLRQAGMQDQLPRGLLHRAALWRQRFEISQDASEIAKTERDLTEAETIAERGSMHIWQIEAALERANLLLTIHGTFPFTQTQASRCLKMAQEKLDETRQLVLRTDKPYEPHVPDWEEWEPPVYVAVFEPGEMVGYHCRDWEIDLLQEQIDSLKNAE